MELVQGEVVNFSSASNSSVITETVFDSWTTRALLIFLYTTVFLVCFFGNLIVLLVIGLHQRMRSITNLILANLAGTDFCVAIFCIFQNLSIYLIKNWFLGNFFCKMYHFIDHLSYTASILILVFISLERYLAIVHHHIWKKKLNHRNLKIIILSLWLVSAGINAPRLYYTNIAVHEYPESDGTMTREIFCMADLILFDLKHYDLVNFLILYLIPLVIIALTYLRIGIFFWKSTSFLKRSASTSPKPLINTPCNGVGQTLERNMSSMSAPSASSSSEAQNNLSNPYNKHRTISPNEPIVAINFESSRYNKKKKLLKLPGKGDHPMRMKDYDVVFVKDVKEFNEYEGKIPNNCGNGVGDQRFLYNGGVGDQYHERNGHTLSISVPEGPGKIQAKQSQNIHQNESVHSQKRVILMLVMIVLVFAMCNAPYNIRKLLQHFHPKFLDKSSYYYPIFTITTNLLIYVNSAVNPILYVFFSKRFQESFKELFGTRLADFFNCKKSSKGTCVDGLGSRKLLLRRPNKPPALQLNPSRFN